MYDIIIIGGGPAGISASIYAASRGQKTLLLEKNTVGGIIGKVSKVTHYAGVLPDETGETFAKRLQNQAIDTGVEIVFEGVTQVDLESEIKKVYTANNTYEAKKVILACGSLPRFLDIPGEQELSGKGMRMNASLHGEMYRDKNVYIVGGADGAIKEALYLVQLAKKVTIIHFEDILGCIPEFLNKLEKYDNVEYMLASRLHAVRGENQVEELDIINVHTNEITTIKDSGCGIFVYAGATPNTTIFGNLELDNDYIKTDENMLTSIPNVYAVGDIRVKTVRQVATAVSDGAIAGIHAAKK